MLRANSDLVKDSNDNEYQQFLLDVSENRPKYTGSKAAKTLGKNFPTKDLLSKISRTANNLVPGMKSQIYDLIGQLYLLSLRDWYVRDTFKSI